MYKAIHYKFPILVLFFFILLHFVSAQNDKPATIQPTIMAIPFTPEGRSLRQNFESNELLRIAITKVKEAFDDRGVNTIDFRAKLKQLNNTNAMTENQQTSIKDEVISLSGADIYVEVEANKKISQTGNSVTVIMTAYDASSGESLANKVASSPKFKTNNFDKLAQKAVEAEIDNLLNTIQTKFTDIVENGKTVTFTIGLEENIDYDFDAEVDTSGDLLSDLLEDWMQDNSFKNYYHLQGVTDTKMIFDIVKVPLKDERGRNYRVSKFASKFKKYLKSLGLESSRTIKGSTIIFTLK